MHTGITSPPRKRNAPDSSDNECSPEQLRLVRPKKKLLVQKPEATVIATGSAYASSPETTPDTSPLPSTLHNAETPKSSRPVQLTPAVLTPSTPTVKYSVPAMVTKLSQKMDVMNKRMLTLEALHEQTHQQQEKIQSTLQQILRIIQRTPITQEPADIAPVQRQELIQPTVPQTPTFRPANVFTFESPVRSQPSRDYFLHIPEEHRIPRDQLENKYHSTKGPGNFAQHIVKLLYPELFTHENHRVQHSYYGGGRLEKTPLSPTRLQHLKEYVYLYYPEMQLKNAYKERVIHKINECLRRPAEQKKN